MRACVRHLRTVTDPSYNCHRSLIHLSQIRRHYQIEMLSPMTIWSLWADTRHVCQVCLSSAPLFIRGFLLFAAILFMKRFQLIIKIPVA